MELFLGIYMPAFVLCSGIVAGLYMHTPRYKISPLLVMIQVVGLTIAVGRLAQWGAGL
jgi:hypothetical protein